MRVKYAYIAVLLLVLSAPFQAGAQYYVPCGETVTVPAGSTVSFNGHTYKAGDQYVAHPCGFNDVIQLAKNIITGWIMAGVTVSALGFAYAGYLYITSAGSMEHIKHAHSIFVKVAIGFFFMLSAWLIVKALEGAFLTPDQLGRSFLGLAEPSEKGGEMV